MQVLQSCRYLVLALSAVAVGLAACSSSDDEGATPAAGGSSNGGLPGGTGGSGGETGGNSASSGGAPGSTGGAVASGGGVGAGGGPGAGGVGATGGNSATGGSTGGNSSTGGATGSGGSSPGTGGTSGSGGTPATGGAAATGGSASTETIGTGSMDSPAVGPAPSEAGKIGGASWVLVKNWNFGTSGNIQNIDALSNEWMYHDNFGTIGNGSNYGAITVAPNRATAINNQPVEDPSRPYREFTADALRTYVRPLSASQQTVTVTKHDAGNGSITAKWKAASGGSILGKDMLWESRVRMPETEAGYWFAIWTTGNKWNNGAEMDVLESFGTPNIYPPPAAFHVNSVGGRDEINYSSWPSGLNSAGVPANARDLREWHTFTWLYRKDDTFVVYFDGYVVQRGTLRWTLGGGASGEHIDMSFLYDFGWGHTQISQVNISLPASGFNITYELDYSRVYLR